MSVQYVVNGVASTWLKRMVATKTFAVCALLVLGAAQQWNQGEITLGQFMQAVQVGVIGILLRSAMAKAELAANASNPDVTGVEAVNVDKKPGSGPALGLFLLVCLGVSLTLTGCSAGSKLGEVITNPDGKPIVSGEICVNTANGRFCYKPNEPTIVEAEATPETLGAASVASAPLAAPASLTVATPAKALEK